jgi:VWFA-related protein
LPSPLHYAAVLVLALPLAAQTTSQLNEPTAAGAPGLTLHANARLVIVDVTVTDAHGAPVHHLGQSAFHLSESGREQRLLHVEEHSGASDAAVAAKAAASLPPLQHGVFTNLVAAQPSTPTILLFDALNTPTASQGWVRRQVLNYLRTAPANTRIAIFGLVVLQNFTSDPARLRAAMEGVHPQAAAAGNLDAEGPTEEETNIQSHLLADQPPVGPGQEGFMEQALSDFEAITQNVNEAQRATMTLRAFRQIALFLAGIPGRKNLIWFSGGFPLSLIPPRTPTNPAGEPTWKAEYHDTMDLMARERIAIYPVDAHGLEISGAGSSVHMEAQTAMYEMAEETGGKAFMNTNGMGQAVAEVLSSGSDYYTLAYVPTDPNAHGEYRRIRIKVDPSSGYELSYRRGYYANAADIPAVAAGPGGGPTAGQAAAAYLAPPARQIQFFARVLPETASAILAADSPRRRLEAAASRRYEIEYSTDLRNLAIKKMADGRRQAHLEFLAMVYDAQGRVIRSDVKALRLTWTLEQLATAAQYGARYRQEISLPVDGTSLRLILHDLTNGRLGSLDIFAAALTPN